MMDDNGQRAISRCRLLSKPPYSDHEEYLFRPYLSKGYKEAQRLLARWMREAGMSTRIDAAGNLIGRYEGQTPDSPVLIIGSHLDTVRDGGCFDGNLGIMLGVEVVDYFSQRNQRFPFAIDVIAFGDEEGSRFPVAMLTSKSVAGVLDDLPQGLCDKEGVSIEQAFEEFGLDYQEIQSARYDSSKVIAYFETHIEQGPVLEFENLSVGIVNGIASQYRFQVTVMGQASHAGTTSMALRRDAMAGSAEIIYQLEQFVNISKEDGVVITTGQLTTSPGAPNVIAGQVVFSIDLRAPTDEQRDAVAKQMQEIIDQICHKRGLNSQVITQHNLSASLCNRDLMSLLEKSVIKAGLPVRYITSGAGHDAMILAHLTPTAMLFIRSPNGISHSPDETVEVEDVTAALETMINFIELKEYNI